MLCSAKDKFRFASNATFAVRALLDKDKASEDRGIEVRNSSSKDGMVKPRATKQMDIIFTVFEEMLTRLAEPGILDQISPPTTYSAVMCIR